MINNNILPIKNSDPEVYDAIVRETQRQEESIELIASENYASNEVLAAQGSILTNKYAEGYPNRRYYAGCEHVDTTEQLAIDRAKKLFGSHFANVQPHSGTQANTATYLALLKPGDTILGMKLTDGGHLTHGSSVSLSGKIYNSIQYGLCPDTENINYIQVQKMAEQYKPKVIIAGFSAFSRTIDWKRFRDIANSINAFLVADIAHVAGLVAAGIYPSPVGIADVITTTTHKTLAGPRGGLILSDNNEELNKKLNFSVFPGSQGGPLCHIIAAKAICFKEAMKNSFKNYQIQTRNNAQTMCKVIQARNFKIVSNGTDNHMFLVNLIEKKYTGKDAEYVLEKAHITVNKNTVPNDPQSPFITSGLRIGTPAITRRGFTETETVELSEWICDILDEPDNEKQIKEIKKKVIKLCRLHPVYPTP